MLERFNFPPKLSQLVMECVTSPSYSILINGAPKGYFKGKRGLRQGDPISPYLFVLCMEVLSRMLGVMAEKPGFGFHPKCARVGLTHLAFADDLLIFCKGDLSSVREVKTCLGEFFEMSGLRVNVAKSTIFTSGVKTREEEEEMVDLLGYEVGTFPVPYLGTPLHTKKLSREGYAPLLDKVKGLIDTWATRTLSYVGRLQLVKAVLGGVLSFWNNILLLPQEVIEKIEGLCRRFLWNGKDGGRNNPERWEVVTLPVEEGGLGVKEILAWNKATLFKLIVDIGEKRPCIWVRWVEAN